jgi:hypothetical protein
MMMIIVIDQDDPNGGTWTKIIEGGSFHDQLICWKKYQPQCRLQRPKEKFERMSYAINQNNNVFDLATL